MPTGDHLGTDKLRKGRLSRPGSRYFVTICSRSRQTILNKPKHKTAIHRALMDLSAAKDHKLHCATVMPDHVHILFTLGSQLSLQRLLSKFKQSTRKDSGWIELWQDNFYDHRVRTDCPIEPFARYIFLNPYRKQLIPINQGWSGWICHPDYTPEFQAHLIDGKYPHPEWLGSAPDCEELLAEYS